MKKIVLLLAAVLLSVSTYAQEPQNNIYKVSGDLIQATLFHDNGTVAQTGFYTKAGKLTGEWISYNSFGEKTAVAQYKDGNRVGTWFFYQNDELREVVYTKNSIASVKTYTVTDTRVVSN